VEAAAPLIQALAKLAEVQVLADEAAFAAATQARRWRCNGDLRLALHVQIDVAAERRGWARRSPA
jgi:valyl-tRNA synthetase